MSASVAETANRTAKALRIADVLRNHGATHSTVRELPDEGWSMAAALAGTKPASVQTRAAVVAILADYDRPAFEGFR